MRGAPRRIFITGASSGIGAALARRYAGPETTLGLLARRGEMLSALAKTLPGGCATFTVDVADTKALLAACAEFSARHGVPDLVIANAGISSGTEGSEAGDLQKLRRILEVNVTGMAATLGAFAPAMRAACRGTLVGIASVAGVRGIPGSGAYSASKAAAVSWLESLRVELAGSGVKVVCISPGYVDTPMTQVNRFHMPFLIDADDAAHRIARAIAAGRRHAVVPWQMAIVAKLLRVLPDWLYDRLAARAPRKPRTPQT